MDVAVVQDRLTQKAGAERVGMEIAEIFDAPIFTGKYAPKGTFERLESMEIHDLDGLPESEISFLYPPGEDVGRQEVYELGITAGRGLRLGPVGSFRFSK